LVAGPRGGEGEKQREFGLRRKEKDFPIVTKGFFRWNQKEFKREFKRDLRQIQRGNLRRDSCRLPDKAR
jgi:hypothetical protein